MFRCFPPLSRVDLSLPLFSCALLPMLTLVFNYVYPCLSMFKPVYLGLLLFHWCLPMFTMFTCSCLPIFTHVYSCLPMYTPVYTCLRMFHRVYLCLQLFTRVYLFATVYLCLFTYDYPYLLVFTSVFLHIP